MDTDLIYAILSIIGSSIGTFGGIVTAQKMVNYRIEQLEKKVEKHNNFASRMPVLEEKVSNIESEVNEIKHKINTI